MTLVMPVSAEFTNCPIVFPTAAIVVSMPVLADFSSAVIPVPIVAKVESMPDVAGAMMSLLTPLTTNESTEEIAPPT